MAEFSNRQKEIIRESLKLLAEKGVQSLTIKNLSNAVNISEPAIYRHFTDKLDLLMSIISYLTNTEISLLKKVREAGPSALDQMDSFFREHFQQIAFEKNSSVLRCSESIFQFDDELRKSIISMTYLPRDAIYEIIEKGQRDGEIRTDLSTDQMTTIIMGAFRYQISTWLLSNYNFDLEAEGRKLSDSIKMMVRIN